MYFYLLSKSESSPRLSCIEREAFRLEITKGMVLYSVQVESISTAHLTPSLDDTVRGSASSSNVDDAAQMRLKSVRSPGSIRNITPETPTKVQ
jgi:hypothetical protein